MALNDQQEGGKSRKDFARERSHQDANTANEFTKLCVQSLILLNRGAATAVASFYGTIRLEPSPASIRDVMFTVGLYAFGVAFAVIAGLVFRRMVQFWSQYWEQKFYGNEPEAKKNCGKAIKMRRAGEFSLVLSSGLFIGASFTVALIFSRSS